VYVRIFIGECSYKYLRMYYVLKKRYDRWTYMSESTKKSRVLAVIIIGPRHREFTIIHNKSQMIIHI
jgi:hypothetical protein